MSRNLDGSIEDMLAWYTESLKLDKHDLDGCCINQPELFERVSSELAQSISMRDSAKRKLADLEASVDAEIRKTDTDRKTTEREIAARVRVDDRVQEAGDKLGQYSYLVNRLIALKEAYEHRRAMIKELVTLYQLSYWGEASGRGLAREASGRKADSVKREQAAKRVPLAEKRRQRLST